MAKVFVGPYTGERSLKQECTDFESEQFIVV